MPQRCWKYYTNTQELGEMYIISKTLKCLFFLGKLSISIRTRNHILFETYTNLFFRWMIVIVLCTILILLVQIITSTTMTNAKSPKVFNVPLHLNKPPQLKHPYGHALCPMQNFHRKGRFLKHIFHTWQWNKTSEFNAFQCKFYTNPGLLIMKYNSHKQLTSLVLTVTIT